MPKTIIKLHLTSSDRTVTDYLYKTFDMPEKLSPGELFSESIDGPTYQIRQTTYIAGLKAYLAQTEPVICKVEETARQMRESGWTASDEMSGQRKPKEAIDTQAAKV